VRDALEEGTRALVPAGAQADACVIRAHEVLHGLLRGPIGRDVEVRCVTTPASVLATADVRLPAWLPFLVPDWTFTVRAVAAREQEQ